MVFTRPMSMTSRLMAGPGNAKTHDTAADHRKIQSEKPLNPHMTNTTSTIANEMPSVGADKAPPELITSVDPDFTPKDSVPENTERMTGGTQTGAPEDGPNAEMGVGEMEGAKIKIEPLRRTGEDANTMRARLLCSLSLHQIHTYFADTLSLRSKPKERNTRERPLNVDVRRGTSTRNDTSTNGTV